MASRFIVPFGRGGGDPILSLHREMNRLFDDMLGGMGSRQGGPQGGLMSMPSLDIHEKGDELSVSVDLPGVKGEDVDVRLDRDVLTISGERKSEQDPQQQSNYHVMERSYGRFSRSMQLPFMPDPNQVSADFEHGVLKIRMKRHAEQERSRRIEVRTGDAKAQQSISQSSGQDPMTSSGSSAGSSSGSDGAGQSGTGQNGAGQSSSNSSASIPSGG